jgi:L-fuculose-phosphate aldolase
MSKPSTELANRWAAVQLVAAGAQLSRAGLILPGEGNLSLRLDEDTCLITPAGADKGCLAATDPVVLSLDDEPIPDAASTEARLHRAVYLGQPEVTAIVHAHPPQVQALAGWERVPDCGLLLEGLEMLGRIAWVGPLPPRSVALAEAVAGAMVDAPACVMYRHGAVTVGSSLRQAMLRILLMERLAALTVTGDS